MMYNMLLIVCSSLSDFQYMVSVTLHLFFILKVLLLVFDFTVLQLINFNNYYQLL